MILARLLAAALALGCAACSLVPARDLVTALDRDAATVGGFETARAWADGPLDAFARTLASPRLQPGRAVNMLAISGGGAGGAFTAGALDGWTRRGGRPEFDLVSGVSTGALIAPFAFLGGGYDPLLTRLYTGGIEGLDALQGPIGALRSGGLMDPAPLRRLVERYATPELLARIAEEHRRGRRLVVVTTNLDAQRPVAWNLGAIAASGRPDALAMVRNILVASASVPGLYPPVMIETRGARGNRLEEMHVDGATTLPVLIAPALLRRAAEASVPAGAGAERRGATHLYVLINNTLSPEYDATPVKPLAIAGRSLSTLSKSQTIWIVKAAQKEAKALDIDFNVADIDAAVPFDAAHPFAAPYMDAVYAIGERRAATGTLWRKGMLPVTGPASPAVATR